MVSRFKKIPSFAGQKNARKFTLYFSQKGREYAQKRKKARRTAKNRLCGVP